MAINLSRNTKVYFTTNVNASTGVMTDIATGYTSTNTFEIGVLDGYSFSQGTQQQTITVSEAGNTPTRGQRAFNTQLDPVEWSISTYIRPQILSTFHTATEKHLWNALMGSVAIDDTGLAITTNPTRTATTGAGAATATVIFTGVTTGLAVGDAVNLQGASSNEWNQPVTLLSLTASTNTTCSVEYFRAPSTAAGTTASGTMLGYKGQWGKGTSMSYVSTAASNKNQMLKFGLLFLVDNVLYGIDNCCVDQVSIDFGLDAIATAAWTGKGVALKQMNTLTGAILAASASTISATAANAPYITNKLSTLTLQSNIGGSLNTGATSTSYTVPITGGNLTIANNINYLVPANLGVVNNPIGYFTGQRAVTGNVSAYLRTGNAGDAGSLLSTLLAAASSTTEPKYRVQLEMGGASNSVRVEFDMNGVVLQIPSVDVQDVVSTTINFNAQGYDPNVVGATSPSFDLTKTNDLLVRYIGI